MSTDISRRLVPPSRQRDCWQDKDLAIPPVYILQPQPMVLTQTHWHPATATLGKAHIQTSPPRPTYDQSPTFITSTEVTLLVIQTTEPHHYHQHLKIHRMDRRRPQSPAFIKCQARLQFILKSAVFKETERERDAAQRCTQGLDQQRGHQLRLHI